MPLAWSSDTEEISRVGAMGQKSVGESVAVEMTGEDPRCGVPALCQLPFPTELD